jgi:hypothetical protein
VRACAHACNLTPALTGAGESGKSTIAKQLKIIHLNGFTQQERLAYKAIIFSNVVGSIRVLVEATGSTIAVFIAN